MYKNNKKEEEPSLRWKIDWLLFNAVLAISQPIKGGQQIKQKTLSIPKIKVKDRHVFQFERLEKICTLEEGKKLNVHLYQKGKRKYISTNF